MSTSTTWGTATVEIDAPMSDVILECAADLRPEPIQWIWPGWLAAGKFHVAGGAPGTGKTTLALAMAATVTVGGRWPDGSRSPIGNVVIWSGEDDPADTLVPRLMAAGADLSRTYFIAGINDGDGPRAFDPARDVDLLTAKLEEIGDVRLLIVDPIVSAISGDSHKNAEVRRGLQPLADLAATMRCAVLGVTHFTKGTAGRDPVERITGSLAFGALARIVMVTAVRQEEDGTATRMLLRAKSNIGPDSGGFGYDLFQAELKDVTSIFASYVAWGEPLDGTARDLLASAEERTDGDGGTQDEVARWLRDLIGEEGGSIDRRDVMKAAQSMGFKERTVHRARDRLGISVRQMGFGKDKRSVWTWGDSPMSAMPASIMPILPAKNVGTNGTNGGTNGGEIELRDIGDGKVTVEI